MSRWAIAVFTLSALVLAIVLPSCLDFKKNSPRDGELVQVFHYGGPGDDYATSIVSLDDGGFVIAGDHGGGEVFDGFDFGPIEGERDGFVARMDRNGNPMWVVKISGRDEEGDSQRVFLFTATVTQELVVAAGNVNGNYVAFENMLSGDENTFPMTYDYDDNGTYQKLTAQIFAFDKDNGDYKWHNISGPSSSIFDCVSDGERVYAVGSAENGTVFYLDVNAGDDADHGDVMEFENITDYVAQCSGNHGKYSFVAAYEIETGDMVRAAPLVGCSRPYDIAVQGSSLVLTGRFKETLGFVKEPGPPNPVKETDSIPTEDCLCIESDGSGFDAFVASIDTADLGAESGWARRIGGEATDDYGLALAVGSDGKVAVVGAFVDSANVCDSEDCDPAGQTLETTFGPQAMFLAQYSTAGASKWAIHADVELSPITEWHERLAMTTLDSGGFLVAGGFKNTATFGPGASGSIMLDGDDETETFEPFMARYEANGDFRWARSECGENADGSIHALAFLTLAGEQIILAAGGFAGTAVFGAGEANETTLVSEPGLPGDQDIFVLQLRDE
jgi:hypothetical protein